MILDLGRYSIEYIDGISAITNRYDALLVDVWGVLHDGKKPYPGVTDCLKRLKSGQKKIVLLSNTARRRYIAESDLIHLGIYPEMYDHLVTSGELTWASFGQHLDDRLNQLGSRYYLIGSEGYGITDELELQGTHEINTADFILTIGVQGNPLSTAPAETILQESAARGLTMVCANPDCRVMRDDVMGIGPGALAARYEELGGQVIYFGKPHRAIYQHCLKLIDKVDMDRVVAVGDSLKTDIAGACLNGIDSILMGSGIHAKEFQNIPDNTDQLAALCHTEGKYPKLIANGFIW